MRNALFSSSSSSILFRQKPGNLLFRLSFGYIFFYPNRKRGREKTDPSTKEEKKRERKDPVCNLAGKGRNRGTSQNVPLWRPNQAGGQGKNNDYLSCLMHSSVWAFLMMRLRHSFACLTLYLCGHECHPELALGPIEQFSNPLKCVFGTPWEEGRREGQRDDRARGKLAREEEEKDSAKKTDWLTRTAKIRFKSDSCSVQKVRMSSVRRGNWCSGVWWESRSPEQDWGSRRKKKAIKKDFDKLPSERFPDLNVEEKVVKEKKQK